MPIEGPLTELGLPEVFQLLELSRKTGVLRVMSRMHDDEGKVFFENGRVVQATLQSKPATPVERTDMTDREFERRVRPQVETVVFDLMSWREGSFSFEERSLTDVPPATRVAIATESLIMEGARRIDEWSRIAVKIPHMRVVPVLAEVEAGHESQLDLLPHEWEVLSLIDGERDLGAIAQLHTGNEFQIAKIVYGLLTIGVVEIKPSNRPGIGVTSNGGGTTRLPISEETSENPEIMAAFNHGVAAARTGDLTTARRSLERFLELAPNDPKATRVHSVLEAATALQVALARFDND
jgi:hypothetical protein